MILEYLWFSALIVISVIFSLIASRQEGSDIGSWQIAAHGAALMSIVISWDGIGAVLLKWFLNNLPQANVQIMALTAGVFIVTTGFLIVAGVPFLTITGSLWFIEKRSIVISNHTSIGKPEMTRLDQVLQLLGYETAKQLHQKHALVSAISSFAALTNDVELESNCDAELNRLKSEIQTTQG